MTVSRWLRNDPPLVYEAMTLTELLATWSANRNNLVGLMAANEVCKRLVAAKR